MVYLRQLILPSERAEIEVIKNEGRTRRFCPFTHGHYLQLNCEQWSQQIENLAYLDTMIPEKCLCKQFAKLEFDAIASKCRVA